VRTATADRTAAEPWWSRGTKIPAPAATSTVETWSCETSWSG